MIQLFYGDDRQALAAAIQKIVGDAYEALSGDKIEPAALPELFLGTSLFASRRQIVVRGLIESGVKPETLLKFTATPHTIILVETKFSTATTAAKQLAKAIQVREFKLPAPNTRVVFDILNTARRNGPQAVQLLDKIITTQEPQQFLGLLASQAVKAFAGQPTPKNQRILKTLAQLDLDLKSSGLAAEPWLLIKGWLLRVASL